MEVKIENYVLGLLVISFTFFYIVVSLMGGTDEPYRDLLLTITVGHFIMSKLITIKNEERATRKIKYLTNGCIS